MDDFTYDMDLFIKQIAEDPELIDECIETLDALKAKYVKVFDGQ